NSAFAAPEPVMDPPVPLDPEPVPLEDPPALDPISAFEETPPPSQDGAPTATPASAPVPLTPPTPAPPHIAVADPGALPQPVAFTAPPPVAVAAPAEPMTHEELAGEIHHGLLEALDLPGVPVDAVPGFREAARGWAAARAASLRPHFPAGLDESELVDEAVERAVGLDEISSLLADDAVFEIVVTPEREVLVDRDGRLASAEIRYETERGVVRAVRCLAGLGGLDVRAPMSMVDARLRNGARLLATLPPLAFRGPSLSVRKTTRDFFTFEKLREYDTLGENVIRFLDLALRFRRNLLLSVGPGVTGTATLNALLSHVPSDERVVTAERGVELHLRGHVHAVGFNLTNGVALRDVLDYATAAQTERVLIGELSEEELSDVVQAFSTSIDGGAAVVAGVSVEDSVARLQTWLNGAPPDLLARAFPVVLQERKLSDASRRVTEVSELVFEGGSLQIEPIFRFVPSGTEESMITGTFVATGYVPSFLRTLAERGEAKLDLSVFDA
ncbi:MAG: ATPase, T2SS/T4P/T4SS family, partial [Myxococcota bacterium]